ncbi:hypothetical protein WA158_000482 [Blastocystis sp. Blastoise]
MYGNVVHNVSRLLLLRSLSTEISRFESNSSSLQNKINLLIHKQKLKSCLSQFYIKELESYSSDINDLIELFKLEKNRKDVQNHYERELETIENTLNMNIIDIASQFHICPTPQFRLSIHTGNGGDDACDWSSILLEMYLKFLSHRNYKYVVYDMNKNENGGIKYASVNIDTQNAYPWLFYETGIHRCIRISPFDSDKQRHTSFSSVIITPIYKSKSITIVPSDLQVYTYRAGGKGGQYVNKTESAVRIVHIPTGTVVQNEDERSQFLNKEKALQILQLRLEEKQNKEYQQIKESQYTMREINGFGTNQIRTYVFHPNIYVKDHRFNVKTNNMNDLLNGDLKPFLSDIIKQAIFTDPD